MFGCYASEKRAFDSLIASMLLEVLILILVVDFGGFFAKKGMRVLFHFRQIRRHRPQIKHDTRNLMFRHGYIRCNNLSGMGRTENHHFG
jgi:hypothetical protein